MTTQSKPSFPPLALEDFDSRLDARAAERGIPTLTRPVPAKPADHASDTNPDPSSDAGRDTAGQGRGAPAADTAPAIAPPAAKPRRPAKSAASPRATSRSVPAAPEDNQPTPRARMKPLNVELPDYVWIELKSRAAREMVSVRHIIMRLLADAGIPIAAADMIEDGRRDR